jgi:hypothetical protein
MGGGWGPTCATYRPCAKLIRRDTRTAIVSEDFRASDKQQSCHHFVVHLKYLQQLQFFSLLTRTDRLSILSTARE